ncbi:DUF3455 domain-containing protein [Streptomyces sp. CdTB01]|uniref:DUF3455 domain-containing protein n=1 Tax=Streptomyces sp. CdTB01 TaxID=1725411 RepID=UPI00073A83B6|nr:DUF3455 domain-containing protein [Streptomyces sp. CdTB01]ALV33119.1 Tat pathway signal sequence domain protein [Streptomyces sp. CdTB01]
MMLSKRAALMTGSIVTAVAAVIGAAAAGHAAGRSPVHSSVHDGGTPVPPELRVPDGNTRIAALEARGVQTYTCSNGAWTFLEPAATLWQRGDRQHRPVALHSKGPVWISTTDGSAVNAAAVPGASVPREHAVPELLLKATATRGDGMFGSVSYIQRLDTEGGVAPTEPCAQGAQIGVPYSATYLFYAPTH